MLNFLQKIVEGKLCPKCHCEHLYELSDHRFKCGNCNHKFSPKKLRDDLKVLHYFSLEIPAHKTAKELNFNYVTVFKKYQQYRQKIALFLDQEYKRLFGEIAYKRSYFCGIAQNSAQFKLNGAPILLGLSEREGYVLTTLLSGVPAENLLNEIKLSDVEGRVFVARKLKSFKSFKLVSKHSPIILKNNQPETLDHFWSAATQKLTSLSGGNNKSLGLYLKEMEFRHNFRKENILEILVKIHFGETLTKNK